MRALITRWTAITSLVVGTIVMAIDASSGMPWPRLALRASFAFVLVVLAGWGAGYVLMRTALRRHYEQGRATHAHSQPRSER